MEKQSQLNLKKNKLKFSVTVTLKKDVLDPQGKVVQNTLINMGMNNLKNIRQGKHFEIEVDEISPDTCRLWDVKTEKKLDKDRFRKDLGNVIQGYQEVARRLGIMPEETNISEVNFGKTTSIKFKKK